MKMKVIYSAGDSGDQVLEGVESLKETKNGINAKSSAGSIITIPHDCFVGAYPDPRSMPYSFDIKKEKK